MRYRQLDQEERFRISSLESCRLFSGERLEVVLSSASYPFRRILIRAHGGRCYEAGAWATDCRCLPSGGSE